MQGLGQRELSMETSSFLVWQLEGWWSHFGTPMMLTEGEVEGWRETDEEGGLGLNELQDLRDI